MGKIKFRTPEELIVMIYHVINVLIELKDHKPENYDDNNKLACEIHEEWIEHCTKWWRKKYEELVEELQAQHKWLKEHYAVEIKDDINEYEFKALFDKFVVEE